MTTYRRLSRAETVKAINDGATLRNDSKYDAPMTIYSDETGKRYITSRGFIAQFDSAEKGNDDFIVLKSSHLIGGTEFQTIIGVIDCKQWFLEADE